MYNQTEKVNIRPKSYLPVFRVSEGDVGRTLTAHLVSDDGDVTIPGGATVTMAGTKPSGLGYTVTGTIDGSDVSFDTDAVMTDEPGRIVSEIRIVQGDTLIGTTNVVLSVEPNPHPDDTTDGRREPLINEITALLESITEQADRAESVTRAVIDMTVTAHESDEATVTKTEGEVINLDFGLPRGPQGIQGIPGEDGQDGVTPDFTIGTVETLAPGEQATATITGTEEDPVLNLGIPRGPKGDKGDPGEVSLETLAKVMVSDTASGTIASFTDGSDVLPAKSVLVTLAPIQDLHGYDKPWVGGAGKNKFQVTDQSGVAGGITFTINNDGSVKCVGTATANIFFPLHGDEYKSVDNFGLQNGVAYKINGGVSTSLRFGFQAMVGANGYSNGGDYDITFDSADTYRFVIYIPNGSQVNDTVYPMVRLATELDATYAPYTNICPISGWDEVETHKAGKNLLPYPYASTSGTVSGITYTMLEDGSVSLSGTATATAYINLHPMTNMFVLKAGTYTVSGASGSSIEIVIGDSDNVAVWTTSYKPTFTLTKDTNVFAFIQITSGTVVDITLHPQIEIGSTATAYEPYQGHTYTTDLPQTVYGGTLDVVSGVLTVDRVYKKFTSSEPESTIYSVTVGTNSTSVVFNERGLPNAKAGAYLPCLSNTFIHDVASRPDVGKCNVNNGLLLLGVPTTITTKAEAVQYLAEIGAEFVYELATPTTIQCDPQTVQTLIGDNNVWGGDGVVVDYYADTKLYIEKMLGA